VTTSTRPSARPFHAFHAAAGAKLVDFAGFELPVRYTGDVREHLAVRNGVGLFDISHMGEFVVQGTGATRARLDRMVTNHVGGLAVGTGALHARCARPEGGIVDDLLVYRYADHHMLVVNAANLTKDFAWLEQHRPSGVTLEDRSETTALLAVQAPRRRRAARACSGRGARTRLLPLHHGDPVRGAGDDLAHRLHG
jgi:aminomethyltransferase